MLVTHQKSDLYYPWITWILQYLISPFCLDYFTSPFVWTTHSTTASPLCDFWRNSQFIFNFYMAKLLILLTYRTFNQFAIH